MSVMGEPAGRMKDRKAAPGAALRRFSLRFVKRIRGTLREERHAA
jgi:hypothetical protein